MESRETSSNPDDELLVERRGPALWVIVNKPSTRNAMTWEMYQHLATICDQVDADHSLRVMVLTGSGGHFVSGADIRQFGPNRTQEEVLESQERLSRVRDRLEQVRVPTIAAIQGVCTGGGALLAASCDLRMATPSARFGFPIARTLGNSLSMVEFARVVSLIGFARTKELILTARLMSADEMLAWGLVTQVVSSDGELESRAQLLAEEIASFAPLTLQAAKESLRRIREVYMAREDSNELLLMCYMSEDFREGVNAFLGKRKPTWQGR